MAQELVVPKTLVRTLVEDHASDGESFDLGNFSADGPTGQEVHKDERPPTQLERLEAAVSQLASAIEKLAERVSALENKKDKK